MTLKERLTTFLPVEKKRKRLKILGLIVVCLLLSGFTWTWFLEFTMRVMFPFEDAVDTNLILNFSEIVNVEDFGTHLNSPLIAEQLLDGIHANVSADIYNMIEIPDMREETLGRRILRTIFDRLFT